MQLSVIKPAVNSYKLMSKGEIVFTKFLLRIVNKTAKNEEINPSKIPIEKFLLKWNIKKIPTIPIKPKKTSKKINFRFINKGSSKAVKNPTEEKQTNPTETLEYFILP